MKMPIQEEIDFTSNWKEIGCHDTPRILVEDLSRLLFDNANKFTKNLKVLDLFAGDGRLGLEFVKQAHENKFNVKPTFLEIDSQRYRKEVIGKFKILNLNAFETCFPDKFDIVVSNPPYLALNSKLADDLGFCWSKIRESGKNLYTAGILKAMEFCKPGGICGIIAPFNWVQGYSTAHFREKIESQCSRILIHANPERNLFRNVHQDIALQIFFKKEEGDHQNKTETLFKYNGYKFKSKTLTKIKPTVSFQNDDVKVGVGSIVWNREKEKLCDKSPHSIPLIYGRNIQEGKLQFGITELIKRQYVISDTVNNKSIIRSPAIVIRRTMRGRPGNWNIDSAIITKRRKYLAENHVIVIKFCKAIPSLSVFNDTLIRRLKNHYYYSGSPCMSATIVRKIVRSILKT